MTVVWAIVGMAGRTYCRAQLIWPQLNFDTAWLTYGRLRPLHTNAVIFAFGGSALFTTSYYVVQRTCQTRLFCGPLAAFTFWGWQIVIVAAAITPAAGLHQQQGIRGTRMAHRHPDHAGLGGLRHRVLRHHHQAPPKHIYVANWFFGSYIPTIAILHIFNNLEVPVSMWKSYSAYAGCRTPWCSGGTAITPWASS